MKVWRYRSEGRDAYLEDNLDILMELIKNLEPGEVEKLIVLKLMKKHGILCLGKLRVFNIFSRKIKGKNNNGINTEEDVSNKRIGI